jgi:myo-inositol 2-dehydrogenase / D-chiro-inositol 1-dehydrogenase
MKARNPEIDRRDFIGSVAAIGAAAVGACAMPASRGTRTTPAGAGATVQAQAPDGPVLKAGLIGCGGRGRGAAVNFLAAGPNLQIAALADVFSDRVEEARRRLKEKGQDIPDSRCFVGFDAYQKLLESGVDVVLHATPPHFRPAHFAAAVDAGKHTFLEKPVAVDVPGTHSVMQTAERAATKGLSVLTGTQLRRELVRMEVQKRVRGGAIGDVQSLRAFRNQGALWYRTPQPGWSDMEYMIRDWVNWTWLSGDIIVEQHIHHLDAMLWVMGNPPLKAVAMGARMRRPTGDQYDFFSADYGFPDGVHLHTTIRQLNGCSNVREEIVVGTKGVANFDGTILDRAGKLVWKYDGPVNDALVQEHVDWVTAIRTGKPMNTAKETSVATLMAIMGRDSAYTGKEIAWDGLLASTSRLGPEQYAMGPVSIKAAPPVPGAEPGPPAP